MAERMCNDDSMISFCDTRLALRNDMTGMVTGVKRCLLAVALQGHV